MKSTASTAKQPLVIDLTAQRLRLQYGAPVLYLTSGSRLTSLLSTFCEIKLFEIKNQTDLIFAPDNSSLIFIDSTSNWFNPFTEIPNLVHRFQCPIVLFSNKKKEDLIKKAYTLGISDVLYAPVPRHELSEILSLFLKFQKKCQL